MTLTIDFTPTEQESVIAAARRKGLDPAAFIKQLVADHLPEAQSVEGRNGTGAAQTGVDPNHFYFSATREEFNAALDEIAQMNQTLPVLTEAAFDRENLYEDRF